MFAREEHQQRQAAGVASQHRVTMSSWAVKFGMRTLFFGGGGAWSCRGSLPRVGLTCKQNQLTALELGAANVLPALQALLGCSPEKNTSKDRRLGLLLSTG